MTAIESTRVDSNSENAVGSFTVRDRPGLLAVQFNGESVITFVNEHVYFRSFRIDNVRFRPGGPVELISLHTSAIYPATALLACSWQTRVISPHAVEIVLTPSKLEGGLEQFVSEKRTYRITYNPAKDRFIFDIRADLHFHVDIRGSEGLHHGGMPQWEGDDYAVIEFEDPLLSGGVGPQVPMTQDWVGMHEPILCGDIYNTDWRKRYFNVMLDTVLRGPRNITFNREVNGVQKFYNRTLPVTRPRRPYLYTRLDGRYLRMTPQFEYPASHHICEWGFDMHFYALLPKAGDGLIFRAGQRVSLPFTMDEIEASEAPADLLNAPPAEIEPHEFAMVDRPIYEEPACHFTASAVDSPDNYAWDHQGAAGSPGSPGSTKWNRTGGHEAGFGSLEFHHGETAKESTWFFRHWGPSYACNPVPPQSRVEVSAWVRADELAQFTMSMEIVGYAGPAPCSPRVVQTHSDTNRLTAAHRDGWTLLTFTTGPTPSLTLSGTISPSAA